MLVAMLDRPIPKTWTVREARDAYLAENGFALADYEAEWVKVAFLGISFPLRNTRMRKIMVRRHDLHHIVTGYGTDLAGEAEISGWELAGGLRGVGLYVFAIIMMAIAFGIVIAPRRTLAAYRAGGATLWNEADYDGLLELTVGELRERLRVPLGGVAERPRALHAQAPVSPP